MRPQDYPITTPFGQVAGYPLNNGFHNGIDYGCPMGTPVVVNGVTIGLSNNTGASTGPHLHVGKYVGGAVQDPGVGNGFNFNSAVVYDTGSDATNGNFVRITGDGALWNYLHLEKVLVTKGQELKGEDMQEGVTLQIARIVAFFILGRNGVTNPINALNGDCDDDLKKGIGQPFNEAYITSLYSSAECRAFLDKLGSLNSGVTKADVVSYINKHLS